MKPLFMTTAGGARARWRAAFPDLVVSKAFDEGRASQIDLVFWDLDMLPVAQHFTALKAAIDQGIPMVALSSAPNDSEAFELLALGVRGYCHAEAVPAQFREVADAVLAGGLWMPQALVQRMADLGKRADEKAVARSSQQLRELTPREEEVALLVGRGYNNRELAEALGVSERTIKANLTAVFDKLGLRDRVQLALYVNRLPIH